MYIIVRVGFTVGGDGVHSRTEAAEDDERRNREQTEIVDVCRQVSSNNRQRPQTINCPQDSIIDPDEAECLWLTKSLSGSDLCGPGERRTSPAGVLPSPGGVTPTSETGSRLFSPFPIQHVNKRRVNNAIRLGLYTVDNVTPPTATAGPQKTTSGRPARYPHSS